MNVLALLHLGGMAGHAVLVQHLGDVLRPRVADLQLLKEEFLVVKPVHGHRLAGNSVVGTSAETVAQGLQKW